MGGNATNPTWKEYLNEYDENFISRVKLIRKSIENNGLIGYTGYKIQELGISFKFSDGVHFAYTLRAWGDLMQAIVGKREGYNAYYM